jgi:hypothetical protein
MPQVFLARSSWPNSPYLGTQVTVFDENDVPGLWTGRGYAPEDSTQAIPLYGDYALKATDADSRFAAMVALTLTIPAGLSPMPSCIVLAPPDPGIVTLNFTGGAKGNGSVASIGRMRNANPAGVGIVALYEQDQYGITGV